MKTLVKIAFVSLLTSGLFACHGKTENNGVTANAKATFNVLGNCEQCQARIEKALAIDGVSKANWDVDSKIITIQYDSTKVKEPALHQAIAASGHDTQLVKATDKDYKALPECCQYKRN